MSRVPAAIELARLCHRYAVRRREEDHIARREVSLGGISECKVIAPAQTGEHFSDLRPGFLARRDDADVRSRMLRQEPQQFHPGVAGAANDADLDHDPSRLDVRRSASLSTDSSASTADPGAAAEELEAVGHLQNTNPQLIS
jgi:hypothetical protein